MDEDPSQDQKSSRKISLSVKKRACEEKLSNKKSGLRGKIGIHD